MKNMSKKNKNLITVVALIVLVFAFTCLVGFTLGGRFVLTHLIIFLVFSIFMSVGSIAFINGKYFLESDKFKAPFILLIIGFVAVFYVMYGALNYLGQSDDGKVFETTVEYTVHYKLSRSTVGFYDYNGEMQELNDRTIVFFDGDTAIVEGSDIEVKEHKGGFGYNTYEVLKVNGKVPK